MGGEVRADVFFILLHFFFFQKPVSGVHSEFSTGHANSPCTIIIGKAHLEKVNVPARPYRMLNNFVINKKVDFNEDLSGKSTTSRLRNRSPSIPLHVRMWTDAVDVYGGEQTGGSTI